MDAGRIVQAVNAPMALGMVAGRPIASVAESFTAMTR